MQPILEIKNISKVFRLNHQRASYESLRDRLSSMFSSAGEKEIFHALHDVSFSVQPGETVGIIGKNGAGKSTLLKILSRITPPSSGSIKVRGKMASLLEVGTGFHPELTGRENIFLNGVILGMRRKEVENKFDAIVDFSGVEKFLDTPLKHYSSGMQLRLAFAVAAFLEPEILIIDEVLAVGDAEFQKKCLSKMEDVSRSGRTVLFVSHNMSALQTLCNRSILLEKGCVKMDDSSADVIREYLFINLGNAVFTKNTKGVTGTIFKKIELLRPPGNDGSSAEVFFEIFSSEDRSVALDIRLQSYSNAPAAFGSLGTFRTDQLIRITKGDNRFVVSFEMSSMANGLYTLSADLTQPHKEYFDRAEQALFFENAFQSNDQAEQSLLQEWNYGFYKLPLKIQSV